MPVIEKTVVLHLQGTFNKGHVPIQKCQFACSSSFIGQGFCFAKQKCQEMTRSGYGSAFFVGGGGNFATYI